MDRDKKILTVMVGFIVAASLCFLLIFGVHYVFGNPFSIPIPMDMQTFTIVNGGDVSGFKMTKYIIAMKHNKQTHSQITESAYCAVAENTFEDLDNMMKNDGYKYIGCDGRSTNVRCYFKDGYIQWVRIEFDNNNVWAVWNFGIPEEYDLAKQGYKTML